MFEIIAVVYFTVLALVAIFRDNSERIPTEIKLGNVPDSIVKIMPCMDDGLTPLGNGVWLYEEGNIVEIYYDRA